MDIKKRQPRRSDDDTEEALARLKEDILTIYTSYIGKETKQNTTVEERWALKELKTNSNIIVKLLDKV